MLSETIEIINKFGLHARAAAKFVNTATQFSSSISLTKDGRTVNGKSIMSVMILAASQGSKLLIDIEGPDENEAMTALKSLIADKFDEEF